VCSRDTQARRQHASRHNNKGEKEKNGGGQRIDRELQNLEGRWQNLLIGTLTEDPGYKSRKTGERQRKDRTEENDGQTTDERNGTEETINTN